MSSAIVEKVSAAGQWFHPAEPAQDARVRLLMFPHAGSGAIIYRDWYDLLPEFVSGQAVTLPGRQERRDEVAYTEWDALVEGLYEAVLAELDERPFAFFGHCLGAQLAYQLSVRMADEHLPTPLLMGMSGWAPKGFYTPSEADLDMPEDEVVGWIKRLGSFPAEIYDNPEMLAMVLPALRADLSVSSQRVDHDSIVPCPMISYGGMNDPLREEPDAFESWVPRSPQYLGHREYPGGHFFIDRYAAAVTQDFCDNLYRLEEQARA